MKKLLLLTLLCFGCATSTATVQDDVTYITPTTYTTCMLPEDCPEQPILSLLIIPSWHSVFTPVKQDIDEVFVTCQAGVTNDGALVDAPEGSIRVTHESEGITRRTYDPRYYDWVPAVPGIDFVGFTNITDGEVDCSATYAVHE